MMKILTADELRDYAANAQFVEYAQHGRLHTYHGISQDGDQFAAIEANGIAAICETDVPDEELNSLLERLGGED